MSPTVGVTRAEIASALRRLGIDQGEIVMVHASMRAIGPVLGGPDTVIQALLDALGPSGTVMMYVDWEHAAQPFFVGPDAGSLPQELLLQLPAFDPTTSRAVRSYGILPEFLRTWPGARRSGNPGASVAAIGARAEWLCADHPLNYGYGPGSPFAKLVDTSGKVLLLGSPIGNVTLLHYSEHMARLEGKRVIRYREPILMDGHARWTDIEEFDTGQPVVREAPEDYFTELVTNYVADHPGATGRVGRATCHRFDAAGLHSFAVAWMERRWGPRS